MVAEVLDHIAAIVGKENISTRIADLYTYGFDASIHHNSPDVVVRPSSAEEISEIVKIANEREIPVMPRGAGTGLCGSAVPLKGGILLDMARMNNIKDIRVEDLNCAVEAGVVYDQLNKALANKGFFFPPTPGSGEDYVLGLRVVLANGDIIDVGTNTLKNSSGYQLERLFVGSEGTLGIITDVVLRISPKPKKSAMAVAAFDDVRKAGECVSAIIAYPMIPSAIELMDSICISAVNKTMNVGFPDCEALCLVEVDGDPLVVEKEVKQVHEICQKVGAISVEFSSDPKQMASWTAGRKAVLPALSRLGEGSVSVSLADDMGVPISKIPDAVVAFQDIAKRNDVLIGTYGHAADGNLHTKMLLDAEDPEAWKNGEKAVGEIFDKCIELGGTVTGEHGVGISKAPWMQKERASSLNAMQAIKQALDPKNILNPGKLQQWEGSIITKLRYPCPTFEDQASE
jgi:glycolate oxidase